jgi:hypothetical protein
VAGPRDSRWPLQVRRDAGGSWRSGSQGFRRSDARGSTAAAQCRQPTYGKTWNSRCVTRGPIYSPTPSARFRAPFGQWSQLIYSIHPGNILAFDGGEDIDRSGQLAIDFPDLRTRYTSELDLLYQGDSPEVGEEVDYKTGWKDWTTEDIRDSFQFQSHAVLALEKYPQWQALRVRVFDARHRRLTTASTSRGSVSLNGPFASARQSRPIARH